MALTDDLRSLLGAARRITGLRVIFRDQCGRSGLERAWLVHADAACSRAMGPPQGPAACRAFCAGSVLRELAASARGRIHTCPFGHTEIAVPVHSRERFLGVLFAGPCHVGPGPLPADLIAVPDQVWLDDRLLLLEVLAGHVAGLLDEAPVAGVDRQGVIVAYIEERLAESLPLAALAAHLGLSPSRCGHHVKELFGVTYPALVRRTRMQAAARLLGSGGLSVAAVAERVGCRDADWFARHFRAVHGCSPAAWKARARGA